MLKKLQYYTEIYVHKSIDRQTDNDFDFYVYKNNNTYTKRQTYFTKNNNKIDYHIKKL